MVMHDRYGFFDSAFDGIASFGVILLLLLLLIVIGGLVFIGFIMKNNHKHRSYSHSHSALRILKERLARGEINEDEYRAKKKMLEEE